MKRKESTLDLGSLEEYKLKKECIKNLFASHNGNTTLRKVGPVVWETDSNPEEIAAGYCEVLTREKLKQRVVSLLYSIYGTPFYCYDACYSSELERCALWSTSGWINLGSLADLNITLLKRHSRNKMDQYWTLPFFTFTEEFEHKQCGIPQYFEELIVDGIRQTMKIQRVTLKPRKVCLFGKGRSIKTKPNVDSPNKIGKVIIWLPSHSCGGMTITHKNQQYSFPEQQLGEGFMWIAFNDECKFEILPSKNTGYRIALLCTLEPFVSRVITPLPLPQAGPVTVEPDRRNHALNALPTALKCITKNAVGFILDIKYSKAIAPDLTILRGPDRMLADKLKSVGFELQVQTVLFHTCVKEAFTALSICDSEKCVYVWKEDFKGHLTQAKEIPFFRTGQLGDSIASHIVDGVDDYQDAEYQALYYVPALIAYMPTWWGAVRLLWIAMKKNSVAECPIAQIPPDVIRQISILVKATFEMEDAVLALMNLRE